VRGLKNSTTEEENHRLHISKEGGGGIFLCFPGRNSEKWGKKKPNELNQNTRWPKRKRRSQQQKKHGGMKKKVRGGQQRLGEGQNLFRGNRRRRRTGNSKKQSTQHCGDGKEGWMIAGDRKTGKDATRQKRKERKQKKAKLGPEKGWLDSRERFFQPKKVPPNGTAPEFEELPDGAKPTRASVGRTTPDGTGGGKTQTFPVKTP